MPHRIDVFRREYTGLVKYRLRFPVVPKRIVRDDLGDVAKNVAFVPYKQLGIVAVVVRRSFLGFHFAKRIRRAHDRSAQRQSRRRAAFRGRSGHPDNANHNDVGRLGRRREAMGFAVSFVRYCLRARRATGESLEDVPARRDRREHDPASP